MGDFLQGFLHLIDGTHAELVADTTGKFHELWNAQAQYYTEKNSIILTPTVQYWTVGVILGVDSEYLRVYNRIKSQEGELTMFAFCFNAVDNKSAYGMLKATIGLTLSYSFLG